MMDNKGKPKEKKPIPDVGAVMEIWAAQIAGLTAQIANLKPHKESICKHPSFKNLDKKVLQLEALMVELRPSKPAPEPMRIARPEFPQLT